jgi:hypothetical protein
MVQNTYYILIPVGFPLLFYYFPMLPCFDYRSNWIPDITELHPEFYLAKRRALQWRNINREFGFLRTWKPIHIQFPVYYKTSLVDTRPILMYTKVNSYVWDMMHKSSLSVPTCIINISIWNSTYYLVTLLPHYMFRPYTAIVRCCLSC